MDQKRLPKRPIAPGPTAGGDRSFRSRPVRKGREEENLLVESDFEILPVSPREIELLSHYLGLAIDELLGGRG